MIANVLPTDRIFQFFLTRWSRWNVPDGRTEGGRFSTSNQMIADRRVSLPPDRVLGHPCPMDGWNLVRDPESLPFDRAFALPFDRNFPQNQAYPLRIDGYFGLHNEPGCGKRIGTFDRHLVRIHSITEIWKDEMS